MKCPPLPALPALLVLAPLVLAPLALAPTALAQAPAAEGAAAPEGATAASEAAPGAENRLPAPAAPAPPASGEPVEPDITIREEGGQTVYEYRVNGQLYMVKVQPQVGPPYYLLDSNGDGTLDVRDSAPRDNFVPQWIIFQWN